MIIAEELTKYYGLNPAVRDVSFRVDRGEIVGFLGPNGAGKTTILRMLTCYMPPTGGKAYVDGLDSRTQSLGVRERIGFLPENVPLYEEMSVDRFLGFAGSVKGLKGKGKTRELDRTTAICGLENHRRRLIKHLSKGLKQRVGLAQALLNDPPVLILDEPTVGLDPAQIIEIRELIRSLGGQRTVLLSSHILPEVSQVCGRIIIINKGRIVAEDTPGRLTDQIFEKQGFRTVVRVTGPSGEIETRLRSLPGVSAVSAGSSDENEFIVESSGAEDIRPEVARAIVGSGWDLIEMRSKDYTLEDVFVRLVTEEEGGAES